MIKATEGSTHIDDRFVEKLAGGGTDASVSGAYHFFSFDSEGDKQAASYIETVGNLDGKLAPVVDVEYYGNKRSNPPARAEWYKNLVRFGCARSSNYQIKTDYLHDFTVYNEYIRGEFED